MKLENAITQAWQKKAWWLWLLLPLSWLYRLISVLRYYSYRWGLISKYRAPIPVMIVGNITVGGSGKTPLIINLVQHLQQQGINVAVISRGYGGDSSQMPLLVKGSSHPKLAGDEPCLIAKQTGVPLAVCPNRQQAIELLLSHHPNLQLIIADDGLQHYKLDRDIEWIVVDANRGFGNKQLLPTGFLREPMARLQGATVIWHYENTDDCFDDCFDDGSDELSSQGGNANNLLVMTLQPDELQPLCDGKALLKELMLTHLSGHLTTHLDKSVSDCKTQNDINKKKYVHQIEHYLKQVQTSAQKPKADMTVYALSGIGYPTRFFNTLKSLGFTVIPHPYPDHYEFSWYDITQFASDDAAMHMGHNHNKEYLQNHADGYVKNYAKSHVDSDVNNHSKNHSNNHAIIITSKDAVKIALLAKQELQAILEQNPSFVTSLIKGNWDGKNEQVEQFEPLTSYFALLSRIWVLPVTAKLTDNCFDTLHYQLSQFDMG